MTNWRQAPTERWLQALPIAVGMLAGTVLMVNRVLTPAITDWQARSDAVGVIACAILLLTGALWRQARPLPPEAVELVGTQRFDLAADLGDRLRTELAWASHVLLTHTVTKSVVLYWDDGTGTGGQVLLQRGILPTPPTAEPPEENPKETPLPSIKPGAIARRVLETGRPVYLVDAKKYPGRIEFDYLPENVQGIIVQPVGDRGVLVLGANLPRSYTNQDERWIESIADKLGDSLGRELVS
jgi:hypothetical protein